MLCDVDVPLVLRRCNPSHTDIVQFLGHHTMSPQIPPHPPTCSAHALEHTIAQPRSRSYVPLVIKLLHKPTRTHAPTHPRISPPPPTHTYTHTLTHLRTLAFVRTSRHTRRSSSPWASERQVVLQPAALMPLLLPRRRLSRSKQTRTRASSRSTTANDDDDDDKATPSVSALGDVM
jgi:hypothetical protein